MIFTYKKWSCFCEHLDKQNIHSIPACQVLPEQGFYVVLKHDVETNVSKAYQLARIEHKFHHCGTYYVQAYLMSDDSNIRLLKEMKAMGHEISYHYDVMDSNKGNIDEAMAEFEKNRQLFEKNGFPIITVCQHGNPVVERIGYTSNRDFFRNPKVRERYKCIADIMVNYAEAFATNYLYFSDAGRQFKMIFDPINNDIVNSDDKNVVYKNLDALEKNLSASCGNFISTHPHRWTSSAFVYIVKASIFKVIKAFAKLLMQIPFLKKIMSKYYYLAKKI